MVNYLLIGLAALAVVNGPSLESMAASGASMDYVVAVVVALMLKPWLQGHLE
ncbi:MAG: hypothetical protein PVF07_02600 [Thiogranum sp.]|jgi:hypothetical protein